MLPSTIDPPFRPARLTFGDWTNQLRAGGLTVLPQSHAVPVDLWVREPTGHVLHLRARGTRLVLRAYEGSAFTTVLLRAECDCEAHRTAGAAGRLVLTPGAQPLAEVEYDGAAESGWSGVAAGLLSVAEAARFFVLLLDRLKADRTLREAGRTAADLTHQASQIHRTDPAARRSVS
jgi:hypothetical protein